MDETGKNESPEFASFLDSISEMVNGLNFDAIVKPIDQAFADSGKFRSVLEKLVDTVEATGGVHQFRTTYQPTRYEPHADRGWTDLGSVYIEACEALGREPMTTDPDPDPL